MSGILAIFWRAENCPLIWKTVNLRPVSMKYACSCTGGLNNDLLLLHLILTSFLFINRVQYIRKSYGSYKSFSGCGNLALITRNCINMSHLKIRTDFNYISWFKAKIKNYLPKVCHDRFINDSKLHTRFLTITFNTFPDRLIFCCIVSIALFTSVKSET